MSWKKSTVNRAMKRLKDKKKGKRAGPIPEDTEQFTEGITKFNRQNKKWMRPDTITNYRVWKKGIFLSDNVFLTQLGAKKKAPALYHICSETKRHVIYALVPQKEMVCPECDYEIPEQIQMLLRLQILKRSGR